MKTYTVDFDQKCTIWSRQTFYVEANNEGEAIHKAKKQMQSEGPDNFEYLVETEQPMSLHENENEATEEWFVDAEKILTNTPHDSI